MQDFQCLAYTFFLLVPVFQEWIPQRVKPSKNNIFHHRNHSRLREDASSLDIVMRTLLVTKLLVDLPFTSDWQQSLGVARGQPTVSLSTTKNTGLSAAMAAQEFTWLTRLLENLHQEVERPVSLYCLSAIKLAENPVFHARTKHVEVHYHRYRKKLH